MRGDEPGLSFCRASRSQTTAMQSVSLIPGPCAPSHLLLFDLLREALQWSLCSSTPFDFDLPSCLL